jgi:hypothetical protein
LAAVGTAGLFHGEGIGIAEDDEDLLVWHCARVGR